MYTYRSNRLRQTRHRALCVGSIGRSIYSLSDWAHLRVFGKSFWHPWGSFGYPRGRFLNNFGALGECATLGSPGAPK